MTIHVMTEGPSEQVLFEHWIPRTKRQQTYRIHPHQGRGTLLPIAKIKRRLDRNQPLFDSKQQGLLDVLPAKLRAFSTALDCDTDAVVVLVDADSDDVTELSGEIAKIGMLLAPKTLVKVVVATEETEAFYLGDLRALRRAYPAADYQKAIAYQPDSIIGTWELFGEIIGDDSGNKVQWAETMGPLLTTSVAASRSPSFKSLIRTLAELDERQPKAAKKKRFYHAAKP